MPINNMKLFITGANGYIGRNFIRKASKKNFEIFALTRKKRNKKIKNVKWLMGSINRNWKELNHQTILIHFAAAGAKRHYGENYKRFYKFNVVLSKKLIENAVRSNCKNWIIISTNKEKRIENLRITKSLLQKKKK